MARKFTPGAVNMGRRSAILREKVFISNPRLLG
jgi:hypothetical protein